LSHNLEICRSNFELILKNNIYMKKNMGDLDKVIRLLIVAVILGLYFTEIISGTIAIVLVAVGFVFVATSIIGFCPLYTLLGINTCKVKNTK
jgi:hypothetical protein